jgi:hypothetical protein
MSINPAHPNAAAKTGPLPSASHSAAADGSRRWRFPRLLWHAHLVPITHIIDPSAFRKYLDASIREISPYYADATITVASVPIDQVRPLSRVVEQHRYRRAKRLVGVMRRRRVPLFEACLLNYSGEKGFRLVLPPVVEQTDRAFVVVDGVHRLTALSRALRPQRTVQLVVISGAKLPRPAAIPGSLTAIKVATGERSRAKTFRKLKPRLFRPAGATLRGDYFRFDSVTSFVEACESYSQV